MRSDPCFRHRRLRALPAPCLALLGFLGGCEILTTQAPDAADIMDSPLPGLTREETSAFLRGDEAFGRAFSPGEGLGPIFNDVSCISCHSGDGRGRPENALTRFDDPTGEGWGAPQQQTRAIPGAVSEVLPAGIPLSVRLPPPVFGVGLIEAIPASAILANADPDDLDGDGISGRPNQVFLPTYLPAGEVGSAEPGPDGLHLGRFGRKAQVATLLEQVVEAYHQDMGITSDFLPEENLNPRASLAVSADRTPDPEVSEMEIRAVLAYIRTLAPPASGERTSQRIEGESVFREIGCAGCHVEEMTTGPSAIAPLAFRSVRLYSDLLLHDMGEDLADHRPDGGATGREWRTAPLWGLRVARDFLNGDLFLLHDGRARSVAEAIASHGGEAAATRDAFLSLSAPDRAALLDFVESR